MSRANPLWGAPRIDGELQARHRDQSNHSWALDAVASQNPLPDLAELPAQPPVRACGDDIFVVTTATFRLLYTLIMLSLDLDRRRVVHFEVTPNPTQSWLSGQMTEVLPCSCSILAELVNIASVARLVPSNAKRRVSFAPHLRESFEPVH
jgi:hypothetical protein